MDKTDEFADKTIEFVDEGVEIVDETVGMVIKGAEINGKEGEF